MCLLVALPTCVFAAGSLQVVGREISAAPGDTVEWTLDISENPGIMAWQVQISWDRAVLKLNRASAGKAFSSGLFQSNSLTEGTLEAIWCATRNIYENGTMLKIMLDVSPAAEAGDYPVSVRFVAKNTVDEDGNPVAFHVVNGSVSIAIEESDPEETDITAPPEDDEPDEINECDEPVETGPVFSNPFTDVSADKYYYNAVLWAAEKGITSGTSATTFGPDKECTRAQIVTFLWSTLSSPEPKNRTNPFIDVPAGSYYYKPVLWAIEQGITSGTSANTFSPDAACTRGQAMTFLWSAEGASVVNASSRFTDVTVDKYFYRPVLWAVNKGITSGTSSTTFSPDSTCTRAQIVTFLYGLFK